jgi:hypothetical protein
MIADSSILAQNLGVADGRGAIVAFILEKREPFLWSDHPNWRKSKHGRS